MTDHPTDEPIDDVEADDVVEPDPRNDHNYDIEFIGKHGVELRWHIGDDVVVGMEPIEAGVDVRLFLRGESSMHKIAGPFSEKKEFYKSNQIVATLANAVIDDLGGNKSLSKSWLKTRLRRLGAMIEEMKEEYEEDMRNPTVQTLVERTADVEVWVGDETEYRVQLRAPNGSTASPAASDGGTETRELVFSHAEWAQKSATPLEIKYTGAFPMEEEALELAGGDWMELRSIWNNNKTLAGREEQTSDEVRAERILNAVKNEISGHVTTDKEKIVLDDGNAWYDADNPKYGEDVLWVRSSLVEDMIIDELGSDKLSFRQKLGRIWIDEFGAAHNTSDSKSLAGTNKRCYPMVVDAFDIDAEVLDSDDDDEDETDSKPSPQ